MTNSSQIPVFRQGGIESVRVEPCWSDAGICSRRRGTSNAAQSNLSQPCPLNRDNFDSQDIIEACYNEYNLQNASRFICSEHLWKWSTLLAEIPTKSYVTQRERESWFFTSCPWKIVIEGLNVDKIQRLVWWKWAMRMFPRLSKVSGPAHLKTAREGRLWNHPKFNSPVRYKLQWFGCEFVPTIIEGEWRMTSFGCSAFICLAACFLKTTKQTREGMSACLAIGGHPCWRVHGWDGFWGEECSDGFWW